MAGNDCAGIAQVCALRVARLDATGATPAGATGMIVTDELVTLEWAPEVDDPGSIEVMNACGKRVVDYKRPKRWRWLNLTLTLAIPDVELMEMLGNLLLTTTANSDGWGIPLLDTDIGPGFGLSLELFSKAIVGGVQATAKPWMQHAFPKTFDWSMDGFTFGADAQQPVFRGRAVQNANFGNGPDNLWTGPSDRALMGKRVAAIPATSCGYQATPAQV